MTAPLGANTINQNTRNSIVEMQGENHAWRTM